MNIRRRFAKIKESINDKHMYALIVTVMLIIAGFGIYEYKRAADMRLQVEKSYQRALTELVDYVNNISVTLAKTMITNNKNQLAILAAELWRESAFAKANLGQLPSSNTALDNTATYLVQVGEYTYALSKKVMDNQSITQKEIDQLDQLYKYSLELSDNLNKMESEMLSGSLKFTNNLTSAQKPAAKEASSYSNGMGDIEKKFVDYTSLIYDGPFSDHVLNKDAKMLQNKPAITADDAKRIATEFVGADKVAGIDVTGEGNGKIPIYNCVIKAAGDGREIFVNVSKIGGFVILVIDNKEVPNSDLGIAGASEKADEFLKSRGYENMKETGYITYGNVATYAFAATQDKFTLYTDLIKIKVSLSDGEILGFENGGYITNHEPKRKLPKILVSEDEARSKIKKNVEITGLNLVLIPLESGQDVFCYEIKTKYQDKTFLMYVNVENAREEKILMLVESENGDMTI